MKFWKLIAVISLVVTGLCGMGNFAQANELLTEDFLRKAKLLDIEPALLEAIYQQDMNQNQKESDNQLLGQSSAHEIYVFYKENVYWVVIKPNPTLLMSRSPTEEERLRWEKQTIKAFMLPNVDSKTFVDLGFGYAKDQHQVYNQNMAIKDADPKTFQVISPYYVKDSRFVYFRPTSLRNSGHFGGDQSDFPKMRVIKGADPVTFDTVDKKAIRIPNLYYSKDNQHVYYAGEIMKEATPNSFSVFTQYPNYSTDSKTVYMYGEPCQNIDAFSFKPVSYTIAKDKNNVYMLCQVMKGIDAESFEFIGGLGISPVVIKDKRNVYWVKTPDSPKEIDLIDWTKEKIPGADPKTFELLLNGYSHKGPYGRDNKRVYYYKKPVLGADPKTFNMLRNDSYGVDKKQIYQYGEPFSAEDFKDNLYNIYNYLAQDGLSPIAIKYLSQLLNQKNNEDTYLYYSFRADMYVAQGELKKAANDYQSAIKFLKRKQDENYKILEIYMKLIPLYIDLKNYDLAHSNILKAETFITIGYGCNLEHYKLNGLKGDIYVAQGKIDDGLKIYQDIKNHVENCYQGSEKYILEWIQTVNQKIEKLER